MLCNDNAALRLVRGARCVVQCGVVRCAVSRARCGALCVVRCAVRCTWFLKGLRRAESVEGSLKVEEGL